MYSLFIAIIYLSFLGLGLPDSLLGSAWPVIQEDFFLPLSYAGYIHMIVSLGTTCASIFTERIVKATGTGPLVVGSTLLTAVAMFGFSLSSTSWMLFLFAIPYGLGAGGVDVAVNNYVALHLSSRHMNWLHCTWGLGAIVSPNIMCWAILHRGWRSGYVWVGVLQTLIVILLAMSLPMWNAQSEENATSEKKILGLRKTLHIKGVRRRLFALMSYSSISAICQLWPSSYLVRVKNFSEEHAAAFASLFFLGMTVGRFAFGFVSDRLGHKRIIKTGAAVIIIGSFFILLPLPYEFIILLGFLIIGIGCSPIFPSFIHSTPSSFGAENSQAVVGLEMGCAYFCSFLIPTLVGIFANHFGIDSLPFILLFFTVLLLLFSSDVCGACR